MTGRGIGQLPGPTCPKCWGPNGARYGTLGHPYCPVCRPQDRGACATAPETEVLFRRHELDRTFWGAAVRWAAYRRMVPCDECAEARHAGVPGAPYRKARTTRSHGHSTLYLCHEHARIWRDEQTRRTRR